MRLAKNILALFGAISLTVTILLVCWWNGYFGGNLSFPVEMEKNPERMHIAHVELTEADKIIFQDEIYDGFFGDGGGIVVAKLAIPLKYNPDAWAPIDRLPDEFKSIIGSSTSTSGGEYLRSVLQDLETVWCLSKLQRNGEHISNIVLFFYKPSDRIVLEWIQHT